MKKISLIILLTLVLVFTFAACKSTPQTYTSPRWERNETHIFTISKALGSESEDKNSTVVKEPGLSNYELDFSQSEEYVPDDIGGKYVMSIAVDEQKKTCTFTTTQELYVLYKTSLLESFENWNTPDQNGVKLSDCMVPFGAEGNPFEENAESTTLRSVTKTMVEFKNDAFQRPLASRNFVNGFYLGKTAQTVSRYNIATTYTWNDKNKVSVSIAEYAATSTWENTGEPVKTTEPSVSGSYESKFIDANQILLYVRSMEKTSTSFQDNPGVSVFIPKDALDETRASLVAATFIFNKSCGTVLNVNGTQEKVSLNAVGVVVGGTALLIQLNVPGSVNADNKNLDNVSSGGNVLDKYSTLRFRSGMISYHIASLDSVANGNQILEAIKIATPSSDK